MERKLITDVVIKEKDIDHYEILLCILFINLYRSISVFYLYIAHTIFFLLLKCKQTSI